MSEADATYLLWLDVRKISNDSKKICSYIRNRTGLYLIPGIEYGKAGEGFLRMNIACPKSRVEDGMERLKESIRHL